MPDDTIRAAGGIVLGAGRNGGKIALVRRLRYGPEAALPKGKLRTGENVRDAALREVREETGCAVRILRDAGVTAYEAGGQPKTVTYFVMQAEDRESPGPEDRGEVVALEWVAPEQALTLLTHNEDRSLIAKVFGLPSG